MQVGLSIFELYYLLDACLRGSHLRSGTVERFVNEFFDKLTEEERYNLYEWALRLTYSCEREFKPDDRCCGADIAFMCRYDPENQYTVTTNYEGKVEKYLTFLMNGRYHTECSRFVANEYIVEVEQYIPKVERTDFDLHFKGRRH